MGQRGREPADGSEAFGPPRSALELPFFGDIELPEIGHRYEGYKKALAHHRVAPSAELLHRTPFIETLSDLFIRSAAWRGRDELFVDDENRITGTDALDSALRAALAKSFTKLKKVTLTDYKVRILESNEGTGSRTRVFVESGDGRSIWGTVGVSDNIIDASWEALREAVEHKLSMS